MTLRRMEHVGIVVDDLTAAVEFFAEVENYEDSVRARPTGLTARNRAATSGRAGWSPHPGPAL
jgi:catechol 2,3-dioxygenase-like lactoylglutathione lyase family enzyme